MVVYRPLEYIVKVQRHEDILTEHYLEKDTIKQISQFINLKKLKIINEYDGNLEHGSAVQNKNNSQIFEKNPGGKHFACFTFSHYTIIVQKSPTNSA